MEQSFSLRELWATIKQSVRLIAAVTLAGSVLGAAMSLIMPKTYTAESSIVLGGYAVPSSIAMQGGLSDSGPLGLEMPPETLVSLATSPVISDLAVKANKSIGDSQEVSEAASVEAPTSNTLMIQAEADSPEVAAERANALADAVLEFRKNQVADQLGDYNVATGKAITAREKRIQRIDQQLKARGSSPQLQGLINERDELSKANAADEGTRANLIGFAESFDGGAVVDRRATVATITKTPVLATNILIGALLGLLGSLVAVVLRAALLGRLGKPERAVADDADAQGMRGSTSGTPRRQRS